MPILDITYHSAAGIDPLQRAQASAPVNVLPPQIGDSQQLDFTTGVVEGAAQAVAVVARVVPDVDCRIAVGVSASATVANSARFPGGLDAYLFVPAGERLSVRAA